ncbi:MAG: hypothetical protein Q9205_006622 [Flavoplaca limonia]
MQSQKVLRNSDTRSFTQLVHKIKFRVTTGKSDLPKHATIMSEQPLNQDTSDTRILWLLRRWLPELFASCLAVLAFISLVVVAKEYDYCGIEATNLPAPLTLNGLVALLSTLIRSTLMVPTGSALSQLVWLSLIDENGTQAVHLEQIDAASRSAWGSLLYLLRAKKGLLANAAAAVMVISLGFGTFIAVDNVRTTDQDLQPGNIARSETWQSFFGRPTQGSFTGTPFDMKAATLLQPFHSSVQELQLGKPDAVKAKSYRRRLHSLHTMVFGFIDTVLRTSALANQSPTV